MNNNKRYVPTFMEAVLVQDLQFKPVAFLVLMSTALFAGCVGSSGSSDTTAEPTATAPHVDDVSGSIVGTVVNSEGLPLEGASVGVLESGAIAQTAADGTFTINKVEPGTYKLQATMLGYQSALKQVTVEAGSISQAVFQLSEVAVESPYYFSDQELGNVQCSVTFNPGVPLGDPVTGFPGDPGWYASVQPCGIVDVPGLNPAKFVLQFNVSAGTEELLIEQQWVSTQATGSGLGVGAEDPNAVNTGESYGSAAGPSPLQIYADKQKVLNVTGLQEIDPSVDDFVVQTRTFSTANTTNAALPVPIPEMPIYGAPGQQKLDFGLALDQKFEVWVTSFVRMEKPEGFTALADA